MTFIVGLVNDQEAVLVTKLQEHGGVGVVAGADGVKVVLLDELEVALHMLHTDDRPGDRVGVMAVDPAELEGDPVEEHLIVLNADLSQADTVGDDLIRSFDHHRIQIRLLRIPKYGIFDIKNCVMGVHAAHKGLCRGGGHDPSLRVHQSGFGGHGVAVIGETDPDSGLLPDQHGGEIIPDAVFGALEEIYIAENAGRAELILVFQVAAVAPLQNEHGQGVSALGDEFGNIEFRGGVGHLAVTNVFAVEPDIEAGVHALKVQIRLGRRFIRRIRKIVQIRAAGIVGVAMRYRAT